MLALFTKSYKGDTHILYWQYSISICFSSPTGVSVSWPDIRWSFYCFYHIKTKIHITQSL